MKNQKPNLLFIFSDQHRWCDMGYEGNTEVYTPNFDKFSANSVTFSNCISNSPLCVPARGTLLTGVYPLKHRAITNDLPIRNDAESIAVVLKNNNYHTGYIGKWHLGGIPRDKYIPKSERLGFDEWKVCNCSHDYMNAYFYDEENQKHKINGYEPIEQTNLAINFIDRNVDKPWGLYLSMGPPHDPYFNIPSKYLDIYKDLDITLRENVLEKTINAIDEKLPEFHKKLLQKNYTKDEIKSFYKGYYAHITALDEQFGRLVDILEKTGQIDNTIIVYTSDHGDMLGSQGLTNKQLPYEESIKVPLIVYYKNKTIIHNSNEMIGLVDLPVSILALMNMRFSDKVDGQDLSRLFTDKNSKGLEESYIFDLVPCHQAAFRGSSSWRGIRTKQYTFARTPYDDGYLLYDNIKDPFQHNNLINSDCINDLKTELIKNLDKYIKKHDELLPFEKLLVKYNLLDSFNQSQSYFHIPIIGKS